MTTSKAALFWNRQAAKYARDPIADQAGYERSLARTKSFLKTTDHVLEIGCGTGSTALHHAPDVAELLGTDVSSEMIAIAKDKLAGTDHRHVDFVAASADETVTPAGSQDVVLAHNILHLVHDLPRTLAAIHTALKPGGLFISKTPCLKSMNPLVTHLAIPLMRLFGKAPYVAVFDARQLRMTIETAGFTLVAEENHSSSQNPRLARPYIVARKSL
jgi:ubiquinone/menaquinone biosynthesis C-methylase UbiE